MLGLSSIQTKLIGGLIAALILLGLIAERGRWMHRAHDAEAQVTAACDATKEAAVNPKLDCKAMPQQIRLLGQAIADLKAGVMRQNAAVNALAAKSASDQAAAAQASRNAQARARGAEATADRLKASSRAGGASSAACEPSKELKETWR